jgi:hypothetical protein
MIFICGKTYPAENSLYCKAKYAWSDFLLAQKFWVGNYSVSLGPLVVTLVVPLLSWGRWDKAPPGYAFLTKNRPELRVERNAIRVR